MKWDPRLYDHKHRFVSQYGNAVLRLLNPQAGERILDIGCGTGDLTQQIAESGALVSGIDSSPEMIEEAKVKFPKIQFEVADAAHFDFHHKFDAIFSNATLHWIPKADHPKVLQQLKKHLKPEGRLVVEMGGGQNVKSIREAIQEILQRNGYTEQAKTQVWFFPKKEEYKEMLRKTGFTIKTIEIIKRPTPLQDETGIENWLQMFGEEWFTGIPHDKIHSLIKAISEQLKPQLYRDNKWIADYERLRFEAIIHS